MKIKSLGEQRALGSSTSQPTDDTALFDGNSPAVVSKQYAKSAHPSPLKFEGLRSVDGGHKVQDIKELMSLPVIITSDMTKSPPVLVVYACESLLRETWCRKSSLMKPLGNPYAT